MFWLRVEDILKSSPQSPLNLNWVDEVNIGNKTRRVSNSNPIYYKTQFNSIQNYFSWFYDEF